MGAVDFLAFGDLGIDSVVRLDHLPERDEKVWVEPEGDFPGGMMGNAAAAAASVGVTAGVVGMVGDDERGALVVRGLAERGVDTSFVQVVPDPTFWTLSLTTPGGDRSLLQFATPAFGFDWQRFDPSLLVGTRWVHTTAEQGDTALALLRSASGAGARTSLDIEQPFVQRNDLPDFLVHTDVALMNAAAAGWFGGPEAAAAFVARHSDAVLLVTLGEAGASLHEPGAEPLRIPAIAVEAIDTNGAGDALAGSFAAGMLRGLPVREAAELAVLVAGLSTTALGGFGPHLSVEDIRGAARERGRTWWEAL